MVKILANVVFVSNHAIQQEHRTVYDERYRYD